MAGLSISVSSILIWVLSLTIAAWIAKRRSNPSFEDYVLAGRSLPFWLVSFSLLGTWVGGGTMIALAGQISREGIVYIFMPIGVAISFVLFGLFARKYRSDNKIDEAIKYIHVDKPTSLVDRVAREYGEANRKILAIVVTIMMLAFMAVQLRAGALVLSHLSDLGATSATIIFALIIGLYIWIGGARADAYTDFIQVVIVLIAVFGGLLYLVIGGDFNGLWASVKSESPNLFGFSKEAAILIPALLILPIFTQHTDSGLQQKILTTQTDKEARNAAFMAAGIFILFGIALVILAILSSHFAQITGNPDGVLMTLASNALHPFFQAFFYAALLAAISSTLDSEAILVSTIMVNDVFFRTDKSFVPDHKVEDSGGDIAENGTYSLSRLWTALAILCGFLLTLVPLKLFSFLTVIWVGAIAAFTVPAIGFLWTWLGNGLKGVWLRISILISASLTVVGTFYFVEKGYTDLTMPLIQLAFGLFLLNLLITIVISAFKSSDAD